MAIVGIGQYTITDLNDPIMSGSEPNPKRVGMVWINTNLTPNSIQQWNGTAWVKIGEDIKIGGVNLIRNSDFSNGVAFWTSLDGVVDYQGKKCAYQTRIETTGESFISTNRYTTPLAGKVITLSFLGACTPNMKSFEVFILAKKVGSALDYDYAPNKTFTLTNTLTKYTWMYTVPSDVESFYLRFDNNASTDGLDATLYITEIKLEEGNQVTAWSPHPLDLVADAVEQSTTYTNTKVSEIKTTTDAITLRVSNSETAITTKTDLTQVQDELGKLIIGGRNLVMHSDFIKGDYSKWTTWGTPTPTLVVEDVTGLNGLTKAVKVVTTVDKQGLQQIVTNLTPNVEYMMSCWVKSVSGQPIIQVNNNGVYPKAMLDSSFIADGLWHRLSFKFTPTTSQVTAYIGKSSYGTIGTYYFTGVKLEQGNKLTDWSPAPEDVSQKIVDESTIINTRIATAEGRITTAENNINLKVSQTTYDTFKQSIEGQVNTLSETTTNKFSEIDQTFTSITSRVSSTETSYTNVNNKIDKLQTQGLGMKVKYSAFAIANDGELYLHGFDADGNATDTDGWVMWNGQKITITKGMVNPNGTFPFNIPIYLYWSTVGNTLYLANYSVTEKKWKYSQRDDSAIDGDLTWTDNHAILGHVVLSGAETITSAVLYPTPKHYSEVVASNEVGVKISDSQAYLTSYVASRGENLVTNGTGLLGNNTNFSAFVYDGTDAYGSKGSFTTSPYNTTRQSDELIPVNPDGTYRMTWYGKCNPYVGSQHYGMVTCVDCDGNIITPDMTMYVANTLTTLAVELVNGATTITLTNSTNWVDNETTNGTVNTHLNSIIIWDYKNASGYQYPPLTYSRKYTGNLWIKGNLNKTTHVITLRVPWSGGTVPVGTQVSQGSAGATYKYIAGSNVTVPNSWTKYTGTIEGLDTTGTNVGNKFHPGTAFVRLGWLTNRNVDGGKLWISNVSFNLDVANQTDIDNIFSDNKLTPDEKQVVRRELDAIVKEKVQMDSLATTYGLTADTTKTDYNTKYTTLYNYVNPLVVDAQLTTTSDVTGATMRTYFADYYDKLAIFQRKVSETSRSIGTTAQSTADLVKGVVTNDETLINANPIFLDWSGTYPTGYASMSGGTLSKVTSPNGTGNSVKYVIATGVNGYLQPNQVTTKPFYNYITVESTIMLESGDLSGSGILLRYESTTDVDFYIKFSDLLTSPTLGKWYTVTKVIKQAVNPSGFTGYSVYPMGGWTAFGTVTAKTIYFDSVKCRPSTQQEINAYESNIVVTDMSADDKITAMEKHQLKKEWDSIVAEKPGIEANADVYSVSKTAYQKGYNDLNTYLNTTKTVFTDMTTTTDLGSGGGLALRNNFSAYYSAKAVLIKDIADASKTYTNTGISNVKIGGRNLAQGTATDGFIKYTNGVIEFSGGVSTKIIKATRTVLGSSFGLIQDTLYRTMILTANQQYTLSFEARGTVGLNLNYVYIMSAMSGNQSIYQGSDTAIDSSTVFKKFSMTFTKTSDSSDAYVMISSTGGVVDDWFEVQNIKVELGNKPTDWSPSPEDIDQKFLDTSKYVDDSVGEMKQDILTTADGKYVTSDDVETLVSTTVASEIKQTADTISLSVTNTQKYAESVNGNLSDYKKEVETYMDFTSTGLILGKSDSPQQVSISNVAVEFLDKSNGMQIPITGISSNGTTVTITYADQGLPPYEVDEYVEITDVVPTAYNGTYKVLTCTKTQVTFASTTTGATTSTNPVGRIKRGFKANPLSVAWINGQMMYIKDLQATNSLIVGQHKIEKLANSNVTLVKFVGGGN